MGCRSSPTTSSTCFALGAQTVNVVIVRSSYPARPASRRLYLGGMDELWVPPVAGPVEVAAGAAAGIGAAVSAPVMTRFVLVAFCLLRTVPTPEQQKPAADRDPGWFGPDSVAWRVHADVSMLVAGMTAFALQTLHPRAMAGVWDHSAFGGDFFGRVRRTGEFVQGVVYDTAADAEKRCAAVRRIHDR